MNEIPAGNAAATQARAIQTAVEKGPQIDRVTANTGQALLDNLKDLAGKAEAVYQFGDMNPNIDRAIIRAVAEALKGINHRLGTLHSSIADIKQGKVQLRGQQHQVQSGVSLGANTCAIIARESLTPADAIVTIPLIAGAANLGSQLDLLGFYQNGVPGYNTNIQRIPDEQMNSQKAKMSANKLAAIHALDAEAQAYAATKVEGRYFAERNFSQTAPVGIDARGRAWNLELTAVVDTYGVIKHGVELHVYCGSVLKKEGHTVDYKGQEYDERTELQGLVHALQNYAQGVVPMTPKLQ